MSVDAWQIMSTEQLASMIESIPNLAAEWRPSSQGGTYRLTRAQIARKIATEFASRGIEVRVNLADIRCSDCDSNSWVVGPKQMCCENGHSLDDEIRLVS
jgi:hypothetical protein